MQNKDWMVLMEMPPQELLKGWDMDPLPPRDMHPLQLSCCQALQASSVTI